jgi:YYY domain-containing protein
MMKEKCSWIYDGLLVAVLLVAAFLRFTGADWGELQHQHPDELFLTSVISNLRMQVCDESFTSIDQCPPEKQRLMGLGDYFNTSTSTLNPHNRGFAFFVYGTLPLFIIRSTAEIIGQTDYSVLKLLGRQFSAFADLGTLLLLYFIVARLYNRRTALLATAFSSLAVMQIQQSHFFTTDLFVNLFSFLALFFAVQILLWEPANQDTNPHVAQEGGTGTSRPGPQILALSSRFIRDPIFWFSFGFGVAFGMALASKLNIYPLAFVLPFAFGLRALTIDRKQWSNLGIESPEDQSPQIDLQVEEENPALSKYWTKILVFLVVGGLMALISFRIFQPYAFDGITLNQQWIENIAEQRGQARGDADLPWNLQWARRTHLYSFENLTVWGLGLPLGLLAWAGFLTMGWRMFKGERRHALLWSWTAFYFIWQSFQFNPTMRYQLPIYPLLAMMAAWFIFELADFKLKNIKFTGIAYGLGLVVLLATAVWAFAFQSIYSRDEPRIAASRWIYSNIHGPINLRVVTADGSIQHQPLAFPAGRIIQVEEPYEMSFTSVYTGQLTEVLLGYVGDPIAPLVSSSSPRRLNMLISGTDPGGDQITARATLMRDFTAGDDPRGEPAVLDLDTPFELVEGTTYLLRFETDADQLSLTGSALANETDYDFPLPFRTEYDGFGGIYRGDLNFQVYWDDNLDKLTRFVETLEQTDYILIPTNHQYAQITRIPERYPLTTVYYRELLGCPQQRNIIECYRKAEPGMFQGNLGFDLVAVFESYPRLGPLVINDQAAEEAFTFYDHPKVLIFKKNDKYNSARVIGILGAVDLTNVVHLAPREVAGYKDLMLPPDRLTEQRAGGTWSQLFDYDWLQNRYPFLGLVWWYGFIFILGLFTYPITRLVMPGLGDKGYALARTFGFVLLSYFSWTLGSIGVSFNRTTVGLVFALIAVVGIGLGWMRRHELAREWKSKRRDFLMLEALFLAFFLFDLLIRLGNPDLWHPSKGGERPMDFSYFNAVLKSTSFPPYDPWFAGGYINYYYYGFVLVATPVKLLGIVPSIAYNLILPTLFAMVAVSAFAIGWKLLDGEHNSTEYPGHTKIPGLDPRFISGLVAALMTVVLGNLGTVQMVFRALAKLAAPGGDLVNSIFFQRLVWAGEGLFKTLFQGVVLPIGRGEWYWNPSRVIPPGPGNEITEFPFFTFLYSDLHAHMIVIPLGLFVIAWALATVKSRGTSLISLVGGALVIGALYPTNLSDIYTYLPVGLTALGYVLWRADATAWLRWFPNVAPVVKRTLVTFLSLAVLTALSLLLYEPYRAAYSQAYSKLDLWTASQTPVSSYLTHWGLFLFIIFFWLIWETRQWMAATPASALSKLKPYTLWIELALAFFFVALLFLAYRHIWVGWIALPLAVWAGLLMLRPALPEEKRLTLFWTGTALLITLIVELVSVRGDIGRMNTIFKFYLQAWVLLSVSAGAAFAWVLSDLRAWLPRWRNLWQGGVIVLSACAFLFTVTATTDKVTDRINNDAPHSLDAMEYMAHAEYWDAQTMDLSQDYHAIRWMQDNVQGSPVIVETNCPEYRWCSRFTIYTGLPGVVGWNWHQRQQRALLPPTLVTDRVDAIGNFYNSTDLEYVRTFLTKYDVRYIVVGQLEQIYYPEEGLSKFAEYNGIHWKAVYHDAQTTIYEVLP